MPESLFNKVAGLRIATLLRKRLWHECFPVNFAKFLRIPFFIEHLWLLLLYHSGLPFGAKPLLFRGRSLISRHFRLIALYFARSFFVSSTCKGSYFPLRKFFALHCRNSSLFISSWKSCNISWGYILLLYFFKN